MSSETSADVAAASTHVDSLIASNQATEALLGTLTAPPIGSKDADVKVSHTRTTLSPPHPGKRNGPRAGRLTSTAAPLASLLAARI